MGTFRTAAAILTGRAAPPTEKRATQHLGSFGFNGSTIDPSRVRSFSPGASVELTDSERDYSASAVAARCVEFIAGNLSAVDMVIVGSNGEPNDQHPVALAWNVGFPDAPYSASVVKKTAWAQAELRGEAFIYLDRGETGTGTLVGMHPIYDPVEIVTEWDARRLVERVVGFILKRNGERIPLLPSEVLWLRYPHPTKRWRALAPWRAALYAHEVDAYARAWQRGEFQHGARPPMLVHLGDVSSEVHEASVASYRSRIAGPGNAGNALIVSGPGKATAQPLSLTPAEMSYIETRTKSAEEVMLAFGLRQDVLFGSSTYENQSAAKTAAWTETLLPKLDVAGSEIDRQLVARTDETVGWDLSNVDALRESEDATYQRASNATYPDIVTIDEARAMLGLEPLPGGLGQMTLTPYREHARADEQIRISEALMGAAGDAGARSRPRLLRVGGVNVRHVPGARAARDARSLASTEAMYARHERIGQRAIARLAERQLKSVLRNLEQTARGRDRAETFTRWVGLLAGEQTMPLPGAPDGRHVVHNLGQRMAADDLFDVRYWTAETKRALEDFLTGVFLDGGEAAAKALGISFDEYVESILRAMDERLTVLAGQISQTTHDVLESDILRSGIAEGASIDALVGAITASFTDLSTWRAKMIARTETVGGCNASAHETARASGVVVRRRWLATNDARTRASHARQDGHELEGMDGRYPNGCRFPGDPEAPANETVACRCVELFETD